MRGIKPKNHNLGTCEANKISLTFFDDKRYILKNGNNTLAYGHTWRHIKMINVDTITDKNNQKKKERKMAIYAWIIHTEV